MRVVFDWRSDFGRVLVVDQGDLRSLRFGQPDGDSQSQISLSDPEKVPLACLRYAAMGMLYPRQLDRALMLGLGGGNFTKLLLRFSPKVRITAVEIDPVVVEVAREYFALPASPRLKVVVADAVAWVRSHRELYDFILHDAYPADDSLGPVWSEEFLREVRRHVAPGGVLVANVASPQGEAEAGVVRAFLRVFPEHACFRTENNVNQILVGLVPPAAPISKTDLLSRASERTKALGLGIDLSEGARQLGTGCE